MKRLMGLLSSICLFGIGCGVANGQIEPSPVPATRPVPAATAPAVASSDPNEPAGAVAAAGAVGLSIWLRKTQSMTGPSRTRPRSSRQIRSA